MQDIAQLLSELRDCAKRGVAITNAVADLLLNILLHLSIQDSPAKANDVQKNGVTMQLGPGYELSGLKGLKPQQFLKAILDGPDIVKVSSGADRGQIYNLHKYGSMMPKQLCPQHEEPCVMTHRPIDVIRESMQSVLLECCLSSWNA